MPLNAERVDMASERALESSRYLVLIPIFVLLAAALLGFVYGTATFIYFVREVIEKPFPVGNKIGLFLLDIDLFLIGATLLIAAIGFHELFLSDVRHGGESRMPQWLQMRDLNDLESRVITMVVLVISITFAEVAVDLGNAEVVLRLGAAIALVIAALTLYRRFSGGTGRGRTSGE